MLSCWIINNISTQYKYKWKFLNHGVFRFNQIEIQNIKDIILLICILHFTFFWQLRLLGFKSENKISFINKSVAHIYKVFFYFNKLYNKKVFTFSIKYF